MLPFKQLSLFLLLFATYPLIVFSQHKQYPSKREIEERVNYLKRIIEAPLNSESELIKIGKLNPEFMLFSCAFSSYALTNICLTDSTYKLAYSPIIKTAILKVMDQTITNSYGINSFNLQADTLPNLSVLYLGHLNLMIGCYRLISHDTSFNALHHKISSSLHLHYNLSKYLFLESYRNSIWIPDNAVAMASLKLHNCVDGTSYDGIYNQWVNQLKESYLDKETGLLVSTINPKSGTCLEEPRGSMLGWSLLFISHIDKAFAKSQYQIYKSKFSRNYLIFRLFKERYKSKETSIGDMDSGPLFRGISIPANAFTIGNAVNFKDFKTVKKQLRLVDFGTKTIKKNKELKYKVKFVDLDISPLAEAMILYSLTITDWCKN